MIFSTDLDRTLLFSRRRLCPGDEVEPAEFKEGKPIGYMTAGALGCLRLLQQKTVFVVNTMRGIDQAERVSFIADGSCRYVLCQNGLRLYIDGARDRRWERAVSRLAGSCRIGLAEAVELVWRELPGVETLSKRYEYLAVFFVGEAFLDKAYRKQRKRFAKMGWDLYRQGKKLYVAPLTVNKGVALSYIQELEQTAQVWGFGDSYFDLPMLSACERRFSLVGSDLWRINIRMPVTFSRLPGANGSEEILRRVCGSLG